MATLTCARCGRENPDDAKFCLECGGALAPAVAPREERKVVSVLFADLVGFTAQAEQLDPEEVRAVLAPYHALLRRELEGYGGTVEKFIGDAVMALFGAPRAHEDDPERAVRAALAIREALAADGRLHVRIGITTGEALVALDARPESGEGMASGDVVNTASRLQAAAPVDGILVDESTYRATSRAIEYRDHAAVEAKGKTEPVRVHEAIAARSRFGVDVRQLGAVPLVGRTRELDLLTGAQDRAFSERQPQLVTLVGVPGIGKSRLVWELFQHVDRGNQLTRWRQGRSLPYAEGISLWALGEIVKAETGVLETDAPEAAAAKLGDAVRSLPDLAAEDAEWIERHLRPLIGLESGSEARGDRRGEAFAAWRRYLEALADDRPLVLVFEDLHWADDGLLDFVDNLVDWATDVPLLIVGTARPELLTRRPNWGGGKPNALTVSLAPLSDAETNSLVGALIEQAVIPVSVREQVLARAQGNPLYAEEFARLIGAGGAVDDLPETVQGIVAARLDGLTRAEKDLLQDAAVLGKVFWSGALAVMGTRPREEVEADLHAMERREFFRRERRSSVDGETEYVFRHIVTRDVAYGQIPRAQRAERHVRAAGWIESLGRPADHAELLAQHYLSALELDRAARKPVEGYATQAKLALTNAADHTMALNSFALAARYLRAALALTAADDRARAITLFNYGKALRFSEEAGADELFAAEQELRAAGDLAPAAEAAVLQAELAWFAGDGEQTRNHLGRAEELVDSLPESYSKAYVLSDLGRYRMLRGEYETSIVQSKDALAMAERLGLDEIRAHALNNLASALAMSGHSTEAIPMYEEALSIARRINSPEQARILNNLAVEYDTSGELLKAWPLVREAVQAARELGNKSVERFLRPYIHDIDFQEGKWNAALDGANELLAEAEAGRTFVNESAMRILRARILLARGDLNAALKDLDEGLLASRRAADPQFVIGPLSNRAWTLLQLERTAEAGQMMDEVIAQEINPDLLPIEGGLGLRMLSRENELALLAARMRPTPIRRLFEALADGRLEVAYTLCDESGAVPQAALVRLAAAEDLAKRGDVKGARSTLEPAISLWRSVNAVYWLERAARVLVPAGVLGESARADVRAE